MKYLSMTWNLIFPMYLHHLWKVCFGIWNQREVIMHHCFHFKQCLTSFDQCYTIMFYKVYRHRSAQLRIEWMQVNQQL
nr:unnamed protein product [Callosobruchus analis]